MKNNKIMRWKMLSPLLLLVIFQSVLLAKAQNFDAYSTVPDFTCESPRTLERVILTDQCGELLSLCYPDAYPKEVPGGFKIWDLRAESETNVSFGGYRFTINFFETPEVDGDLDFATELTFANDSNTNFFDFRNITLHGNASGDPGVQLLRNGAEDDRLKQGDFFDLAVQEIFINFFASRKEPQRGFNLSYCADFNQCDEDFSPSICNTENGICVRNGFENYTCNCIQGYEGGNCSEDVNECGFTSSPCGANALCNNTVGSYQCTCDSGYAGDPNIGCIDIDECDDTDLYDCDGNATCRNEEGSFTCVCNNGFRGTGLICSDIDECDEGTHNCNSNAVCSNAPGNFSCTCNGGYSGNGVICNDNDECADATDDCADLGGNCTNTDGDYACSCLKGFTGNGFACNDIDECMEGTNNCATDRSLCTDTDGSFTCSCLDGYSGDGVTCVDIDECSEGPNDCADGLSVCMNNNGSFACACISGYTGDGRTCANIDECMEGTNNCATDRSLCTDTDGSFTCSCLDGYSGDGVTCVDIDECAEDTDNCDPNADCSNTLGSFNCLCKNGFSGNGIVCADINECETRTDNCTVTDNKQKCVNLFGSFGCACNEPEYRGTYPNCVGYFCPAFVHMPGNTSFTTCTIPGTIEWPIPYDGVTAYKVNQMVSWFVDLEGQTATSAIRFTFINLSVESAEDYIIFSTSSSIFDVDAKLAVFTGEMNGVLNDRAPATSTNPIGYDDNTKTYTLPTQNQVYIHFFSDRGTVSTGFQINYEPDMDDCDDPSRSECQNGGTCQDLAFDYVCQGCPGFEGKNCETNIDECATETDNCDSTKATCTDLNGSFNCTCFPQYYGSGVECRPLIRLSNLTINPISDASSSRLLVNFDLTNADWSRNISYITNYVIILTDTATGMSFNVTTNRVDSPDFLPIEIPVTPATDYRVSITYGTVGELFDVNGFVVDADSQDITISSGSTATAAPANFMVIIKSNLNLIFNWTKPTETGRGIITEYEIGYERTADDCRLFLTINDQTDCGIEKTIRFPASRSDFALTGLQQYRSYQLRLRTYTSAGASEWSNVITAFTGDVCDANKTREGALSNMCLLDRSSMSSDNFPNPYEQFETLYWQVNFAGKGAIKIVFDYFSTEENDDFVDIGQGLIPLEPINVTANGIVTFTGNLTNGTSSVADLLYTENDQNNGVIFVRFTADLFVSAPGFQIHYETNASQCEPNPCLSGGTCLPTDFNFACECPSLWTGVLCSEPLVELNTNCEPLTSESFLLTWSVDEQWEDDATVIEGYTINYAGLAEPVLRPIGTTSFTMGGFSPYESIVVTVNIRPVNPSATFINANVQCRTGEARSTAPNSLLLSATSNSIQVNYAVPTSPNGNLVGYTITYIQLDADDFNEDANEVTKNVIGLTDTITGLRSFRNYSVAVAARNGAGIGEAVSATILTEAAAPQEPVSGLNASDVGPRSVVIAFNPPMTVTGSFRYEISFVPDNGNPPISTTVTSLTVSGLTPDTLYSFTVTPFTSVPEAGPINSVTATTSESTPGRVSTLAVDPLSSASINVTWGAPNQPNGNIIGYSLIWTPGGDAVPTDVSTATSFVVSGLNTYTDYAITVYARTSIGDGERRTISTRTLAGAPVGTVQNVEVSLQTTQVDFTITPPMVVTGVFSYIVVYTIASSGMSETIITTSVTGSLTGLVPNTLYNVEVFPISGGINGTEGYTFDFTTVAELPGPVSDVSTSTVTATSVIVSWRPPANANGVITGYRVTWSPSTATGSMVVPADTTSYEVTGLNPFTSYMFMVVARNEQGESDAPVSVTAVTSEAAPTQVRNLLASTINESSITVSFQPPSPANGVLLYYNIEITHDEADCLVYDQAPCDVFTRVLSASPTAEVSFIVTGLRPYRLYNVDVTANTSAGESAASRSTVRTASTIPGEVQNLVVGIVSSTSISVMWDAATPFAGASNYIVQASGTTTTTTIVTAVISDSPRLTETVTLNGLPEGESYVVKVFVNTTAGVGITREITRFRVNTIVPGGTPMMSVDQTAAVNALSFVVNNPCRSISNFFGELGGPLDSIQVIVKEASAPAAAIPLIWATAIDLPLVPPFIAGTITCQSQRKKRSLTEDGLGYVVGANSTCSRTDDTPCNGPLIPGRNFEVAFRAQNPAGTSNTTEYSEEFAIPAIVSTGLEPGEIAAIVICSLIVLLIIILLIVFLVRRKKM